MTLSLLTRSVDGGRFRKLYQTEDTLVLTVRENVASELVMSGIEHITWVALDGEYETYTVTLGESGKISIISNRMYVGTLSDDSIITGQGAFAGAYGADGDDVIEILSGSS